MGRSGLPAGRVPGVVAATLLLLVAGGSCGEATTLSNARQAPASSTPQPPDEEGRGTGTGHSTAGEVISNRHDTSASSGDSRGADGRRKVALLVGISAYKASTGWPTLHTEADLERLRAALEGQGFAPGDIHEVKAPKAGRGDIETAFRSKLIEGAGKDAVVFFHYSGHGHRLTDDDHDEPDGYDEVLVPVDAPQNPPAGYTGEKHIRDDDLNDWIAELRTAVGPGGDVFISLDSCFSGSGIRATATARGSTEPIGPPQLPPSGDAADLAPDAATGFIESASRGTTGTGPTGGGDTQAGEPGLAPYAFFSAARHDELAFETRDESDRQMGSLSYALGKALAEADDEDTYRGLFARVKRLMAGKVRNQPQAEATLFDRKILGGEAVDRQPFLTVAAWDAETGIAKVRGGALAALLPGSRVSVQPPESTGPDAATALAEGTVVSATPFLSDVELEGVAEGADIESGWVFITERIYGSAKLSVMLDALGDVEGAIATALAGKAFVETVDADAAVRVLEEAGDLLAVTAEGTVLFRDAIEGNTRALAARLVRRLDDYSRNQWLRAIDERSRRIEVGFEIRPCRLEIATTSLGQQLFRCAEPLERRTAGDELALEIGDGYELAITNTGRRDAHVTILSLWANGEIHQLWPEPEHMGADNLVPADGEPFVLPDPMGVGPPPGVEMLKLIATDQPVDYSPITTNGYQPDGARGFIDTLFDGAFEGSRSSTRVSASSVATSSQTFTIVEVPQ